MLPISTRAAVDLSRAAANDDGVPPTVVGSTPCGAVQDLAQALFQLMICCDT